MSRRSIFDREGEGLDRFGLLLVAAFLAVSLNSLFDLRNPQGSVSQFIGLTATSVLSAGTLLLAIRAAGVDRRYRRPVAAIVTLGVVGSSISFALGGESGERSVAELAPPPLLTLVLALITPLLVCRRLVHHRTVTVKTILGAVAAYLLIALALFYVLLALEWVLDDPVFGSVQPTTSFMYFSLTTITTLGYGDLSPVAEAARYASVITAVIGQVFLVVFVALIVSRFQWGAERDDPSQPRSASE